MAKITALATATPDLDFQQSYHAWAVEQVPDRQARVYQRMAGRSGIDHRWSVLPAEAATLDRGCGLYGAGDPPGTAERMRIYAEAAPDLALQAVARLRELGRVTHLVAASCTGFVAPGIDQVVARRLGLGDDVERVLIGFMGCYAAVSALRTARHIVRSDPAARVLVLTVELSSLHHQRVSNLEALLANAQFGDGAAAAIVEAGVSGLALGEGISATLDDSADLIRWEIGDTGFVMHLAGEVPAKIAAALSDEGVRERILAKCPVGDIDGWAVHAGGRSILDAVEKGLGLAPDALDASRQVLRSCGNMSSSTLMFALRAMFERRPGRGIALAFGPGLAMEGFRFGWRDAG